MTNSDAAEHSTMVSNRAAQKVATSLLQRRLGVGYGRAAKIIDRMEALGYVSAPEGNKARKVLITAAEYAARMMEGDDGEYEEDDYS